MLPADNSSMIDGSAGYTKTVIDRQPILLERFEVVDILGQGAAGAVYRVIDQRDPQGRQVALKVLIDRRAFDENTMARFEEELRVCRSLRHANIVEAYELIKLDGAVAFSMEYVDGVDLGKLLSSFTTNFALVDSVMIQLMDALHELHLHGIVHRDVKLENVLLRKDGVVKLTDLGLMKDLYNKGLTGTGVLLGTAQYLPPEYVTTGKCDGRGDLYSAGIMLMEMVTAKRRLAEMKGQEVVKHLSKNKFRLLAGELEEVPLRYRGIVARAMEVNPERRFQSALEMQGAFCRGEEPLVYDADPIRCPSSDLGWLVTPTEALPFAVKTRIKFCLKLIAGISLAVILVGGVLSAILSAK